MNNEKESNQKGKKIKINLITSCIYYLILMSDYKALKNLFLSSKMLTITKKIFKIEDKSFSSKFSPLMMEETFFFRNGENILQCLTSLDQLNPIGILSFRLISKIASNLQNKETLNLEEFGDFLNGSYKFNKLRATHTFDARSLSEPSQNILAIEDAFKKNVLFKIKKEIDIDALSNPKGIS